MHSEKPAVKPGPPSDRQRRRAERRGEMVQAAIDAVRTHGPAVSVAEIAAVAGITKPVLYRHFTDRADLQRAVGQEAAAMLMARMAPELDPDREPAELVRGVIDAFLAGIEDEPELWRFVVHHPIERAPGVEVVDDAREQIARMLAMLIGERLRGLGLDSGGAEAWAQGLVGMVQSAGDWWLERRTMSRGALTDYLTTLIWGGMSGVLGTTDAGAPLRLVPRETGESHG
ncbi:TetR/AcrR family transcriptional regulator [Pseudonocardia nigra]|uniref:TetR/AcrR family transcriptional regulator n=1 Tax=Pseudonocardia nigra TaxID=1921578 RepID=UPI0027E33307|nr:TetR/AcrR family transcriptional regulator [Pseudonocardia nigra]